jgi:hypothetical protein
MDSRNFIKCEWPLLTHIAITSFENVDPLLNREKFAVTLRKQKRTEIIAMKRRKMMQQQPDQDNEESKFLVDY